VSVFFFFQWGVSHFFLLQAPSIVVSHVSFSPFSWLNRECIIGLSFLYFLFLPNKYGQHVHLFFPLFLFFVLCQPGFPRLFPPWWPTIATYLLFFPLLLAPEPILLVQDNLVTSSASSVKLDACDFFLLSFSDKLMVPTFSRHARSLSVLSFLFPSFK